jgi:ArsR family transcriptional regulator
MRVASSLRAMGPGSLRCQPLFPGVPAMNDDQAVAALSALAQPTRLKVYRLLANRGEAGMPAGAIAEAVEARPNTLSTHLQALLAAGLVSRQRAGRRIVYRAHGVVVDRLMSYLNQHGTDGHQEPAGDEPVGQRAPSMDGAGPPAG